MTIFDVIENEKKEKCKCYDCSYYVLSLYSNPPYEHCYKHNIRNHNPCDLFRCAFFTTSRWVKFKTLVKFIFVSFDDDDGGFIN